MRFTTDIEFTSALLESVEILNKDEIVRELEELGLSYDKTVSRSRDFLDDLLGQKPSDERKIPFWKEYARTLIQSGAVLAMMSEDSQDSEKERMLEIIYAEASKEEREHLRLLLEHLKTIDVDEIGRIQERIKELESATPSIKDIGN